MPELLLNADNLCHVVPRLCLPTPMDVLSRRKVAEDIHQALAADDACAADSCGLGLLQARVLLHLRKRS